MPDIIAHSGAPSPARLALRIVPRLSDRNVGELVGRTLYLDPTDPEDEQLAVIADVVAFLRTGRTERGERPRHLRAVP